MKKIYLILSIVVVSMILVTSCKKNIIYFDDSMSIIGFSNNSLVIGEADAGSSDITLYLGGALGAATDIVLTISTDGYDNPAVEGVDFTLSTTTLSMTVGENSLQITPIDNAVFEGNKKFDLLISSNTAGYDVTAQNKLTVTINDDEHPLKAWIGTYDVDAASYGDPGNWDEAWVVVTSPVEGDVTKLSMLGIGGGDDPIIADFDTDNMTISIAPGQDCGNAYGYDIMYIYYGFSDLTLDKEATLTGTISPDGTIVVDNWGHNGIYGGDDYGVWDVFNTTWTLQ